MGAGRGRRPVTGQAESGDDLHSFILPMAAPFLRRRGRVRRTEPCRHTLELWRFVSVQQRVAELAKTAIDFPPMQAPASFNLEAVKARVDEAIKSQSGQ